MDESLTSTLRKLRLSVLTETLEVRLHEAQGNSLTLSEFLELILQDELLVRDQLRIVRRVKAASFRSLKSLNAATATDEHFPRSPLTPRYLAVEYRYLVGAWERSSVCRIRFRCKIQRTIVMHFGSESSPGFAIGRVAYLIRAGMAAVLKSAGWPFSPEETQTLITLSDAGEALSMNELASLMVRDPTTVKRQLDRLVEHEFVERNASSQDARIVMISLTRRGEQKLQKVLPLLKNCAQGHLEVGTGRDSKRSAGNAEELDQSQSKGNELMNRNIISLYLVLVGVYAVTCQIANAQTQVEPETALRMLNAQQQQFDLGIVKVSDNVFTAVGYHGANTSMIVGDDGAIIIDTLMSPTSAAKAAAEFRKFSDKVIKAIIYTHSHPDHIGGASAFVGDKRPDIYATESFGSAEGVNKAVGPIKTKRMIRQFGVGLSPNEVTNLGVAPARTPDKDEGKGFLAPTITVPSSGLKTTIAGVEIEFHIGPGETDDAMFIWLPEEKVLFAGDNFYSSFPNLYAIRGTAYRDVLKWSESVAKMAEFKPHALVPGYLAGGTQELTGQMNAALAKEDFQWALELSDYLKWLDDADRELVRKAKIKALRGLAAREYNAPNRNYYLRYANELESGRLSEVSF